MSTTDKKTDAVTIKGTAGGLLVRLRDDATLDWSQVLAELTTRLETGERFFRGGQAHLELGARVLEAPQLEELQTVLTGHGIELATLISGAQATRRLAKQVGLNFHLPNSQNTQAPKPVIEPTVKGETGRGAVSFDTAEALFLRRTIRSGQRIEHHADVIVLGDVNPGAEIISAGNVIVWGTVRGQIQAGQSQPGSVICALCLWPTQLRIGEVVAVGSPEAMNEPPPGPEIASLQDGNIVVESWLPKRGRR